MPAGNSTNSKLPAATRGCTLDEAEAGGAEEVEGLDGDGAQGVGVGVEGVGGGGALGGEGGL
ncbi:hypothetical protein CHGG_06157 [Chaetomium globosum CBS 148.51]|uniref:Uncharacterized protein n=1 Tax=Chaetomium globosum (strain ATCC 6205 / CBS 148.51 / DSM 1962 / NBRC 6347 / NRRL 1970) TaxID=306901 RepID=Q2H5A8_CHAGB|nr:uncharacterized protein CHGG_06157 [Chaetomium globosum CBS 148.51]EAQ89538.1 hypothetical protein CHGG_06157 [Chaetomium globosum CBS 148.51]